MVAVRVLLVWEVVGASVILEPTTVGDAVDVAVLVFSTELAGEALLVWEVVFGEPVVLPVVLVDVARDENVLVLEVMIGASDTVATGVDSAATDVSTVISGEALLFWEMVV